MCRIRGFNMEVTSQGEIIMENEPFWTTQANDRPTTPITWVPDQFLAPEVTITFRRRTIEELLEWNDNINWRFEDDQQLEVNQTPMPFDERMDGGDDHMLQSGQEENPTNDEIELSEEGMFQSQNQNLDDYDQSRELEVDLQDLILQLDEPLLASMEDDIITV